MLSGYLPLQHPYLPLRKTTVTPHGNWSNANGLLSSSQSFQSLRQFLSECPWSTNQASSSFSSPRIWRPCSALRLASARFTLIKPPCLILASVSRARPSLVLGPVLAPPWSLQRPTGSLAGRWHKVPRRVRASHRIPCQFGPYSHGLGLAFIVLNYHRFMGFYYTPSWMALLGMRVLVRGPRSEQN